MLATNFLEQSAKKTPDKVALVIKEERHTYAELNEKADKVAGALLSDGLSLGDRVAIFLDNSLEAVAGLFGVLKAGGVFFMVNPTTKAEKLLYMLKNCRASALIAPSQKAALAAEAAAQTPSLEAVYLAGSETEVPWRSEKRLTYLDGIFSSPASRFVSPRRIDADLANIVYTSGSTGNPKGVMMTHLNMISAVNSITEYLENTSDDIILSALPMSFDYGLYQVLMAFKCGATLIIERSFLYPYKIIETLLKERVTGFPIVPTMSAILLQMEDIKKHSFEHLRYITNTAAALPVPHIKKMRELFPKARIYSMYGLTECKRVSYLPPEEIDRIPSSVGKAMPNTEAYIVDENGHRVPPGVVGELVVRGSNVMRGYWEMPEDTARRLRPGETFGESVLYTGDLFKADPDGYLYFVARKDDIIKSRGEKVSPKEIENALYGHEAVLEAAVIGVADPILGQSIKAFVVLKEGATLTDRDIMRHCSRHLEDFMVPKIVEFVKELPKTDSGKIRKTSLT